jgi:hypothetical protein
MKKMSQKEIPRARRMTAEAARQLREGAERIQLAQQGAYRCDRCKGIRRLHDGVVTFYKGQPVHGLCPKCFGDGCVVIKRTDQGIQIKTGSDSLYPDRKIEVVRNMPNISMPRPEPKR